MSMSECLEKSLQMINSSHFYLKRYTTGIKINLLLIREKLILQFFSAQFFFSKNYHWYILGLEKQYPNVIEDFFQIVGKFSYNFEVDKQNIK